MKTAGGEGGIRTRCGSEGMVPFHRAVGRLESTEVDKLVSGLVSARAAKPGRRCWEIDHAGDGTALPMSRRIAAAVCRACGAIGAAQRDTYGTFWSQSEELKYLPECKPLIV